MKKKWKAVLSSGNEIERGCLDIWSFCLDGSYCCDESLLEVSSANEASFKKQGRIREE